MADANSTLPFCSRCETHKSLSDFYVKKSGKPHAWCRECSAAYARERRSSKGNVIREQARKRRKDPVNKEKVKAANQRYYGENRERLIVAMRARWALNRETNVERLRQRYRRKRTEHIAQVTAWQRANPERVRQYTRSKNHRRRAATGTHTSADIQRLFKLQRGHCAACSKPMKTYHVDHRIALSCGGSNDWTNLQLLHPRCNLRKHARDPIEYMQSEHGLLL